MAKSKTKKDEVLGDSRFEFEYRLKERYRTKPAQSVWLGCTLESKNKLDFMYPNYYEFKEAEKEPLPTPNAIEEP